MLELARALAALLRSGMPIVSALNAAHRLLPEMAETVDAVRTRVTLGGSLASALEQGPSLSAAHVGLIRAGERSGDLARAFERVAEEMERAEHVRARLTSAAVYPMLLAGLGGLAIVVLLLLVLPRFAALLASSGATLPQSTSIVIAVAEAARSPAGVLGAAAIALLVALATYGRASGARRLVTSTALRVPLLRGLLQDAFAARFARLTGTLMSGSAPLLTTLDVVAESLSDPLARVATARIRARIREGTSLHEAVQECGFFPPLLSQLIAVGDASGKVGEFLIKAAEIFEDRTERTLQRLVALAEPVMIVVFGGIVGFIALALLQAIYSVNASAFQ